MALADDVARLVQILVRQHQGGPSEALRLRAFGLQEGAWHRGLSVLGKAAGATGEQVSLWEAGVASPTCAQGLAWLSALYELQPPNGRMQLARQRVEQQARQAQEPAGEPGQ